MLRAIVPIALPHPDRDRQHGNRLGQMIVPLPLGADDPVERLRQISMWTTRQKMAAGPRHVPVLRSHALQRAAMRVAAHQRAYNVYVANIHGPDAPLYLARAELLDVVPIVPLMGNQTLGVGALSYAGHFNILTVGDLATCPDVNVFADALQAALRSLAADPLPR